MAKAKATKKTHALKTRATGRTVHVDRLGQEPVKGKRKAAVTLHLHKRKV